MSSSNNSRIFEHEICCEPKPSTNIPSLPHDSATLFVSQDLLMCFDLRLSATFYASLCITLMSGIVQVCGKSHLPTSKSEADSSLLSSFRAFLLRFFDFRFFGTCFRLRLSVKFDAKCKSSITKDK